MMGIPSQRRGSSRIVLLVAFILILLPTQSYIIRPATESDVSLARKLLIQEKMNPFMISTQTMLVAATDPHPPPQVDDDNNDDVLGFGQIRPLNEEFSELASLFVRAEHRHQGIGGRLVEALLERHRSNMAKSKVCLLTLKPTSRFYKPLGFQEATEDQRKRLPKAIQVEYMAGKALSTFLGTELVCMIQS